jgi:hypothetical protein
MCVPSGFPLYIKTLHGLVAAENILDGPGHDVMDSGYAVGRWRPFVKDERRMVPTLFKALVENSILLPISKDFFAYGCEVELLVFLVFFLHPSSDYGISI